MGTYLATFEDLMKQTLTAPIMSIMGVNFGMVVHNHPGFQIVDIGNIFMNKPTYTYGGNDTGEATVAIKKGGLIVIHAHRKCHRIVRQFKQATIVAVYAEWGHPAHRYINATRLNKDWLSETAFGDWAVVDITSPKKGK